MAGASPEPRWIVPGRSCNVASTFSDEPLCGPHATLAGLREALTGRSGNIEGEITRVKGARIDIMVDLANVRVIDLKKGTNIRLGLRSPKVLSLVLREILAKDVCPTVHTREVTDNPDGPVCVEAFGLFDALFVSISVHLRGLAFAIAVLASPWPGRQVCRV